jgi:GNAT superfamily N-acetyltransferase
MKAQDKISDSREFTIRAAQSSDAGILLTLIRELAEYERLLDAVVATEDDLRRALFGEERCAEALIAESGGDAAGFALFFTTFSTFVGRPGIWLEDIYVRPAFRRHGIGLALFRQVAALAIERHCGRMEWSVLDWNEPAINFYRRLGATAMSDWTTFRWTPPRCEKSKLVQT